MAGFFGGEGFILQKLSGEGDAFIKAGGALIERDLAPGEILKSNMRCVRSSVFLPTLSF
jgi:uncharacterized protein (AIM24 family)